MNEKNDKTSLKSTIDLKIILLTIALIVIFMMLIYQNIKINGLTRHIALNNIENVEKFDKNRKPRKEFIGEVRKEFFNNLNKEMRDMDSTKQRIQNEMNKYFDDRDEEFNEENIPSVNNIKNIDINLKSEEEYNKDKKIYMMIIYLPKDFSEKNINISIDKGMLYVKIAKNEKVDSRSGDFENNFSSLKIVNLPSTKATTKDIKKTFKDGKLEIIVPII